MARRWGLGPVFAAEWLTTSRRWQVYAGRVLFVGVLLLGLASVWASQVAGRPPLTIRDLSAVGRSFFAAIVFTQLTLVLIAAPAATAGGICQDKARGNLAQLLLTDLSDAEIVLGKLASRLVPVLGLVCCALPVLAMGTLLGGIDPLALAGTFLITLGVAVLSCTIALTFSIWGTKPHEVLLATFAVLAVWLLMIPIWQFFVWFRGLPPPPVWMTASNPFQLAAAPYIRPGTVGPLDYLGFLAASLAASAALAVLSIRRIRPVVIRQEDRMVETRRRGVFELRIGQSPSLDADPVLWYEAHRKRHTPWVRAMIWIYIGTAIVFNLLAIEDSLRAGTPAPGWFPAYVNAFQVVIAMPLIVIGATTATVEERVSGSLDVLLATPLPTRGIVLAKWWNVFRIVPLLLPPPTLLAIVLARESGRWAFVGLLALFILSSGAAWTSLGLAISTWVSRLGRALAAAVVLFAVVGLGWPILALTLFGGDAGTGLSMVSPFYGVFNLTFCIEAPYYYHHPAAWGLGWIVAHFSIAALLLLATLATFNRAIGRIDERPRPMFRISGGRERPARRPLAVKQTNF